MKITSEIRLPFNVEIKKSGKTYNCFIPEYHIDFMYKGEINVEDGIKNKAEKMVKMWHDHHIIMNRFGHED